jgi:hypothetical protein
MRKKQSGDTENIGYNAQNEDTLFQFTTEDLILIQESLSLHRLFSLLYYRHDFYRT